MVYAGESFKMDAIDKFLASFKSGEACAGVRAEVVEIDPAQDVSKMKLGELKRVIASYGAECDGCIEKTDFVKKVQALVASAA